MLNPGKKREMGLQSQQLASHISQNDLTLLPTNKK
jgi:hypothetical protein